MRFEHLGLAAAGALAFGLMAVPAAAADFTFTSFGTKGPSRTVTMTGPGSPTNGNFTAVVITLQGTQNFPPTGSVEFDAFCIDISTLLQSPPGDYNIDTTNFVGPKWNNVRRLAGLYFANPTGFDADQRAALQMAIWQVIYTAKSFSSTAAVNTHFNTYMSNLLSYPVDWGARFIVSAPSGNARRSQDLIIPGVVPEPATWALLVSGFGLIGLGLRRRQRQGLAATTA